MPSRAPAAAWLLLLLLLPPPGLLLLRLASPPAPLAARLARDSAACQLARALLVVEDKEQRVQVQFLENRGHVEGEEGVLRVVGRGPDRLGRVERLRPAGNLRFSHSTSRQMHTLKKSLPFAVNQIRTLLKARLEDL